MKYYIYERKPDGLREKLELVHEGTQKESADFYGKLAKDGKPLHRYVATTLVRHQAEQFYCSR